MPEKKDQRVKSTPTTDSERETRVLLEDVRSELKIVAEGHTSVVKRLDKVEDGLQEVKGGLQEVKGRLAQHDQRFDRIEGQLSQLQQQVGTVLTDHESRLKILEVK